MVSEADAAIASDAKTKVFGDTFKDITNGVKAATKWGSNKITSIVNSKTYDKVMDSLAMGVAAFGVVVFAAEAVWALTFVIISPILALAVFTCDIFLALFCLKLLSELLQQMAEPKPKKKKK